MRTLGIVGLSVLLVLVLLYQSYMLTEGFGFGVPSTPTATATVTATDASSESVSTKPLLGPGGLGPAFTRAPPSAAPMLGPGGLGPQFTRMPPLDPDEKKPMLGPGGLGPQWTWPDTESNHAPYRPSAADRKQQRAKLLRDIQKIVRNEMASERSTTGSRYPSNRSCNNDYEDSCDNSPALQQGCEMEDTCN